MAAARRLKNSERHRARKGDGEGAGESGLAKRRRAGGEAGGWAAEEGGEQKALKLVVKADRALLRARRPCSPTEPRVYIPFMPGVGKRYKGGERERERDLSFSFPLFLSFFLSRPLPIYLNARARRYESSTHLSSSAGIYTG